MDPIWDGRPRSPNLPTLRKNLAGTHVYTVLAAAAAAGVVLSDEFEIKLCLRRAQTLHIVINFSSQG